MRNISGLDNAAHQMMELLLGMVPLAFELGDGAEMWASMARGVIGGMTVSTLLTLLVIPVAYVSLAGWVDRRRARKQAPVVGVAPGEEQELRRSGLHGGVAARGSLSSARGRLTRERRRAPRRVGAAAGSGG
jgi:hypothetical protein